MLGGLDAFSKWLAATPGSQFIQVQSWIIPAVQTAHILAIAVVLSSVGMVNLRVLGFAGGRTTIVDTARRYVPWVWGALGVLLLTGAILVWGEPERDLLNPAFQTKMLLVIALAAVALAFQAAVRLRAPAWDAAGAAPAPTKLAAAATMALCLTIAVLGRWIAYAVNE